MQASWRCVWLQIQSWWCHAEGKTLTACTVKGCIVWWLWETWNVRKTLSRCVMPPSESSAVQWGHRYAWLRFPWRFLVPRYHRWILQIVFLCLTFSTFLYCFVWFCFEGGQKDVVVFLIVWGLFLWVGFFGFFFFSPFDVNKLCAVWFFSFLEWREREAAVPLSVCGQDELWVLHQWLFLQAPSVTCAPAGNSRRDSIHAQSPFEVMSLLHFSWWKLRCTSSSQQSSGTLAVLVWWGMSFPANRTSFLSVIFNCLLLLLTVLAGVTLHYFSKIAKDAFLVAGELGGVFFGNKQASGLGSLSYMTFFSPVQGGIDPPDICNVTMKWCCISAFMCSYQMLVSLNAWGMRVY